VIGELFLEGKALFDLSQLLAYRRGQYDPWPSLEKVCNVQLPFEMLLMDAICTLLTVRKVDGKMLLVGNFHCVVFLILKGKLLV
jgi:hypothetical protein